MPPKSATTTPPPPTIGQPSASVPSAPPTSSPELQAARARIADLERSLREASDTISSLRMNPPKAQAAPVAPATFSLALTEARMVDASAACSSIGPQISIRFPEGPIGVLRRQRYQSLLVHLIDTHAVLADGQHVDERSHAIFWLLDMLRIGQSDQNPALAHR